jgi:hypothetical protein
MDCASAAVLHKEDDQNLNKAYRKAALLSLVYIII